MDETRKEGKKEFEPRFTSELFAWGESLMGVLIAFVIIFTFVVRLFGVDGCRCIRRSRTAASCS